MPYESKCGRKRGRKPYIWCPGQKNRQKVDANHASAFCHKKSKRFPHITKGHGQNIVHSLLCTDNHGKKSNQTSGSLHFCLPVITLLPDEITKAHKIRRTLYNVSSVWIVQSSLSSEVDLIYKSPYCLSFVTMRQLYHRERYLSTLAAWILYGRFGFCMGDYLGFARGLDMGKWKGKIAGKLAAEQQEKTAAKTAVRVKFSTE